MVHGLRFGGVLVVPLLGLYVLFDYRALPLFAISTAASYLGLLVIERRIVLYGRRLLVAAIVTGALVPITTVLVVRVVAGDPLPLRDVAYVGSILPGIAAFNLHRLDREERITDVVGSLALVVGLVLLAAVFVLSRSVVLGPASFETIVTTAERLVLGSAGPIVPEPAPVIPRAAVVGLFVVGLLLNEGIQMRYGLRLAGLITLPLIATFALQNARLLALYVAGTAVAIVFIRLVHGATFLYGRSLLGGTCIMGVLLATLATPLLPDATGLRPLIVGLLAGVTAYNSHVLAPGERVQSIALNGGVFVGLFALADAVAFVLGRPFFHSPTEVDVAIGVVLLVTAGFALLQFERLRPDRPIETFANGDVTVVPDGGSVGERDLVTDGGVSTPLTRRRVARIGPNARLVYRDKDE